MQCVWGHVDRRVFWLGCSLHKSTWTHVFFLNYFIKKSEKRNGFVEQCWFFFKGKFPFKTSAFSLTYIRSHWPIWIWYDWNFSFVSSHKFRKRDLFKLSNKGLDWFWCNSVFTEYNHPEKLTSDNILSQWVVIDQLKKSKPF